MFRQAVIIFFVFSLGGCVNAEFYRNYSGRVDSLSAALEEMALRYEALDTVLIMSQYDSLRMHLDSISQMPEITLDSLVVDYKNLGKRYKTFWRGHPLTLRELRYTREQLADLKHDIDHYQLEKDLVAGYFLQEEESVRKLKDRMDLSMVGINGSMRRYRESTPRIIHLIDSVKIKVHHDE